MRKLEIRSSKQLRQKVASSPQDESVRLADTRRLSVYQMFENEKPLATA